MQRTRDMRTISRFQEIRNSRRLLSGLGRAWRRSCSKRASDVTHRKTRLMRQGVRQHLAGLVVNTHENVMRPDFDRLKATLTNCVRSGPASQNREAHPEFRSHLEGRVTFVEAINPAKAVRLRRIFEQIEW